MRLSIIIPVYNEKNTVLKLIKLVEKVNLGTIKNEIIIIDCFPNDRTMRLLKK